MSIFQFLRFFKDMFTNLEHLDGLHFVEFSQTNYILKVFFISSFGSDIKFSLKEIVNEMYGLEENMHSKHFFANIMKNIRSIYKEGVDDLMTKNLFNSL